MAWKKIIITGEKSWTFAPQIKEIIKVLKHVPPSVTACIFTLKNTDPDNFRDRPDDDKLKEQIALLTREKKEDRQEEAAANLTEF